MFEGDVSSAWIVLSVPLSLAIIQFVYKLIIHMLDSRLYFNQASKLKNVNESNQTLNAH